MHRSSHCVRSPRCSPHRYGRARWRSTSPCSGAGGRWRRRPRRCGRPERPRARRRSRSSERRGSGSSSRISTSRTRRPPTSARRFATVRRMASRRPARRSLTGSTTSRVGPRSGTRRGRSGSRPPPSACSGTGSTTRRGSRATGSTRSRCLTLCDTMPGAVGERMGGGLPEWWAPSADLTVHLLGDHQSEWVLAPQPRPSRGRRLRVARGGALGRRDEHARRLRDPADDLHLPRWTARAPSSGSHGTCDERAARRDAGAGPVGVPADAARDADPGRPRRRGAQGRAPGRRPDARLPGDLRLGRAGKAQRRPGPAQ